MFPPEFENLLAETLGKGRASGLLAALEGAPELSVRVNPAKISPQTLREAFGEPDAEAVPWEGDAFYLRERPSFTLDPLFHAGAYYVQEASSMYVGRLAMAALDLTGLTGGAPLRALDLCAAPGGKSTQLLSLLPRDSLLVCNEAIRQRAFILADNIAKWGAANSVVTNDDPSAFSALEGYFDLILADLPCSGEGMFRKDRGAVAEWSPAAVKLCAARQRRIVADVWPALRPGGCLIYSTCTFNDEENGRNVGALCASLGGSIVEERRFLPGEDRGEGFYCALIRKNGGADGSRANAPVSGKKGRRGLSGGGKGAAAGIPARFAECVSGWIDGGEMVLQRKGDIIKGIPAAIADAVAPLEGRLHILSSGVALAQEKGGEPVPHPDLALSTVLRRGAFGEVPLTIEEALRYLRREPLSLPGHPAGYLLVTYGGLPLGWVKNLGSRANNLYPASRRILKG